MPYSTQKKSVLIDVLQSSDRPLTPNEICEVAQKEVPRLGIATVYRAIKQFVEEGSVRLVDVPGAPPHYEHSSRQHHHFFFCDKCRKLFHLLGCVRGINALAPDRFQVKRHEIVLYGNCEDCVSAG